MKKPTLNESRKAFLKMSINTNESSYSLYAKEQDKYIKYVESEHKELIEKMELIHNQLLNKEYKNARVLLGTLIYCQQNP